MFHQHVSHLAGGCNRGFLAGLESPINFTHTHNDLGLAFTKDACSTSENTNILRCLAKLRAMGLSKVCGWWAFCTPIYEEVLLMILMCFKDFKNATSTMHCQTVEGLVACTCFS